MISTQKIQVKLNAQKDQSSCKPVHLLESVKFSMCIKLQSSVSLKILTVIGNSSHVNIKLFLIVLTLHKTDN